MSEVQQEHRTSAAAAEEAELLARLRDGDERAFEALVESYHGTMIAVARGYVKTRDVAEEVVQEAWLGVIKGLDRFEGRSSLKTWILRILVNTAMTRGGREGRSVPFSSLKAADEEGPSVEPERFRPSGESFAGHWNGYPGNWATLPEEGLLARETIDVAKRAVEELPDSQRSVIAMRDIAGCSAEEVCDTLEVSPGTSGYFSIAPARRCEQHSRGTWMSESNDHITCQEVVELVTDYFEGALPADEADLFEQHLNFCEGCDWYVDQMRATVAMVGRVRAEDVPPETRERLLTAFREWKRP